MYVYVYVHGDGYGYVYVYMYVSMCTTCPPPKLFFFSSLNKKAIDNLYTKNCCWIIYVCNGLNQGLWWITIEVFIENFSEMLFIFSSCYCDGSSFALGSNSIVDVFDKTLSCKVVDAIVTSSYPHIWINIISHLHSMLNLFICSSVMLSMRLLYMNHLARCWTHYGCLWLKAFLWCY